MAGVNTRAGEKQAEWLAPLLEAVRAVRFGSVELTIHDARVVQVERRERIRLAETPSSTRLKTDRTGGSHGNNNAIDWH
jgi:hypothetical protein